MTQVPAPIVPRGAVTPGEVFVPLGDPIDERVWTTAEPKPDNTAGTEGVE